MHRFLLYARQAFLSPAKVPQNNKLRLIKVVAFSELAALRLDVAVRCSRLFLHEKHALT